MKLRDQNLIYIFFFTIFKDWIKIEAYLEKSSKSGYKWLKKKTSYNV